MGTLYDVQKALRRDSAQELLQQESGADEPSLGNYHGDPAASVASCGMASILTSGYNGMGERLDTDVGALLNFCSGGYGPPNKHITRLESGLKDADTDFRCQWYNTSQLNAVKDVIDEQERRAVRPGDTGDCKPTVETTAQTAFSMASLSQQLQACSEWRDMSHQHGLALQGLCGMASESAEPDSFPAARAHELQVLDSATSLPGPAARRQGKYHNFRDAHLEKRSGGRRQGFDDSQGNLQRPGASQPASSKSAAGRGNGEVIQSPKQLMCRITTARNLHVLNAVVSQYICSPAWDVLCSSVAMKRAGQLARAHGGGHTVQTLMTLLRTKLVQQLRAQQAYTEEAAMHGGQADSDSRRKGRALLKDRPIADIMWALAHLKVNDQLLLQLLVRCYLDNPLSAADTSATRIIWSAGALGLKDPQLLQCAVAKAQACLMQLNEVELSQMCVGLARLRSNCGAFLQAIAYRAIELMPGFNAQNIANVSWTFATLGVRHCKLLAATARHSVGIVHEFNAKAVAITAWSFATLGFMCPRLMSTLSRAAVDKISSFNSQDIATLAWSCVSLSFKDLDLMNAMAKRALVTMQRSNSQDVSITIWAYAVLGVRNMPLFEAAASYAIALMPTFKPQDVANTVWGLASMDVHNPALMEAAAQHAKRIMRHFSPQEMANALWAYARLGVQHQELLTAACNHAINMMRSFGTQDLVKMVTALAMLGVDTGPLLEAVAARSMDSVA